MASKSDNYPKSCEVNQAGIRWKEYVHNWRGLIRGDPNENAVAIVTTKYEESAEAIVANVRVHIAKGRTLFINKFKEETP